jgi:hypothetical protein
MSPEEERDKIEELRKSLYSKENPPPAVVKRRRLHEIPHQVSDNWQPLPPEAAAEKPVYEGRSTLFKRLFIFAAIFFAFSIALAAVVYFRGSNVISPNNIGLSVIGPVSVAAGEVLTLDVDITNRNSAPLQLADLTFDYPDGTKTAVNIDVPLKSDQVPINQVSPGATVRGTSRAVLYGPENSRDNIKITLTYRIPGSNAVFTKQVDYNVLIASAPVSLSIDSLKEVISNQDLNLKLHLTSNAVVDLKNLLVQVDYPFGFTYASSSPTPSFQNKIWSIPLLSPGQSRDIIITGKMTGQDGDQRVFHISTGVGSSSYDSIINTVFINTSQTVAIAQPFLSSDINLDGDTKDTHVVQSGKTIHGQINWHNNLSTDVTDASITLQLAGSMLDKASVTPDKGFYRSIDNTIIWDKTLLPDLADIPPGGSGTVDFIINTYMPSFDVEKSYRNPSITLNENIQGHRISESNVPESINSTLSRTILVASNLSIVANPVFTIGPFTNTGPLPPTVDKTTTYTINWAVTNSYNRVDNVVVTATLPPYVKWLGKFSPADEQVAYNPVNNQISWQIGQLGAGTGFVNSPKTLSFQISLTPSISQVGSSPALVNQVTVKGLDNFTSSFVGGVSPTANTRLLTDPNFQKGQESVIE